MSYLGEHLPEILTRTAEHLALSLGATIAATAGGIPLGVAIERRRALERPILALVDVVQTIPSLALFGLLLPLPLIGGIGATPAVIALFLYALLPIVRTTVVGIRGIDPSIVEAARGLCYRAATQQDKGAKFSLDASMAKLYCTETANF